MVDTYYNRIRTTQAVARTYSVSRFSDLAFSVGFAEALTLFETDSLAVIFACVNSILQESATLICYFSECFGIQVVVFCFLIAALCKCAQFLLFVWLPDAMEAPTPASALIHSSTLVVMGIFLLLRLMPLYANAANVLTVMLLVGSITVAYGALFAIFTSDLKKAVAYSTISQIGYLFCGCGFLAVRETLVYLALHAICKAMLFICVGYIVHLFGGTTSMRRMGGIYHYVPFVSSIMFVLCLNLAGAPYTTGFLAKEFLVLHILSVGGFFRYFVLFCWVISFVCTPIYLARICILPIFGYPRAS